MALVEACVSTRKATYKKVNENDEECVSEFDESDGSKEDHQCNKQKRWGL